MSNSKMIQRLSDYALLMRLDKPIGTLLLAWPTLWALWLAGLAKSESGWQNFGLQLNVVLIFLAGIFLMRSAGCVINDFADRDIDKHVKRTAQRPLTTNRVSGKEALVLFTGLALLAFCLLFLLPGTVRVAVMLWSIPAVLVAVAYPFMKRFFATPQLVLGIAFSFAIPMAFAAYGHGVEVYAPVCLLAVANTAWVIAYDTQYAMVDRDDDIKIGLKSTALYFGKYDRQAIIGLQIIALFALFALGIFYSLGVLYFFCLMAAASFFVYQAVLLAGRDRQFYFRAFMNNTWFGAAVWVAIILGVVGK